MFTGKLTLILIAWFCADIKYIKVRTPEQISDIAEIKKVYTEF